MSTKENNDVAVEKVIDNDKSSADAKCEIKGTKRPAEVSFILIYIYVLLTSFLYLTLSHTTPFTSSHHKCLCRDSCPSPPFSHSYVCMYIHTRICVRVCVCTISV